jgi:hypothetical protein
MRFQEVTFPNNMLDIVHYLMKKKRPNISGVGSIPTFGWLVVQWL